MHEATMQQRQYTRFLVCQCNDTSPLVSGPYESEQLAWEYAQETASEYGETMRLFAGPDGSVLPGRMEVAMRLRREHDPLPSEMTFIGYVDPAKATGKEPWAIFASNHASIGPPFEVHSPELDSQELRFWLTYWDEIGVCDNNVEPRVLSPTEQLLRNADILNRYVMNWACEVEGRELVEDSFLFTFQRINKTQPGKWSAAIEGRSLCYPPLKKRIVHKETGEELSGVLVTLDRALPVPATEVILDDVLEFRQRHRDELLAFRASMEAIFRVVMATNATASFDIPTETLNRALADLRRIAGESSIKFVKGGFEARLKKSVPNLNWTDQTCGLSVVNTPLRAAELKVYVRIDAGLKRPLVSDRPYSYISKIQPEHPCA
jgi:hypothetical protein